MDAQARAAVNRGVQNQPPLCQASTGSHGTSQCVPVRPVQSRREAVATAPRAAGNGLASLQARFLYPVVLLRITKLGLPLPSISPLPRFQSAAGRIRHVAGPAGAPRPAPPPAPSGPEPPPAAPCCPRPAAPPGTRPGSVSPGPPPPCGSPRRPGPPPPDSGRRREGESQPQHLQFIEASLCARRAGHLRDRLRPRPGLSFPGPGRSGARWSADKVRSGLSAPRRAR